MAQVKLSARAFADLERIFEFLAQVDPMRAQQTVRRIRDAVMILEEHPLIGRSAEDGRRELVIGRRANAYVAMYRWLPASDTVLVLAVRHAREAGYLDP